MTRFLAWGKKVDQNFRNRVLQLGKDFNWELHQVNYLMACMAFESGETFSPSIKNAAGSGATGLIQFMPFTAQSLGTTTFDLAKMSAERQLDYVQKYFKPYASRVRSLEDMYMAILMPKFIGTAPTTAVFSTGTVAYNQNRGLDSNKDGVVTVQECANHVRKKLMLGLSEGYAAEIG